MAAIEAATPLGIVEVDVQLTSDGVPVLFHDDTLMRMTGDPRRVGECGIDDLATLLLKAGDGGEAALTEHAIPTLAAAAASGAFFDYDVKHPAEIEAVAGALSDLGAEDTGTLKVDTFNDKDIADLLALQSRYGVPVMAKVMLPDTGAEHIAALAKAGVCAAEVFFSDLGQLRRACDLAGEEMAISTYTLDPVHCCGLSDAKALGDPDAVWGQIIEAGVDILMTDRAPELSAYLATRL